MERISLLPPEIKNLRLAQQKRGRLFFLFLIFLILLIAVNLFFIVNAYFVRENLKSLQQERAIVEEQAALLLEYEDLYQKLLRAEKLVSDAMGTVPIWSVFLRDISQTLPVETQLSELRINYSNQSGTVTMRGWVNGHSGLAVMLEKLFTMEQLDQIQCRSSTETDSEGQELVQFLIDSVLLTGPGYFADKEGGD